LKTKPLDFTRFCLPSSERSIWCMRHFLHSASAEHPDFPHAANSKKEIH
jgi:hypothetical protein